MTTPAFQRSARYRRLAHATASASKLVSHRSLGLIRLSLRRPQQPVEVCVRFERRGIWCDLYRERSFGRALKRFSIAYSKTAQRRSGDFPILFGVTGDNRL